MTQSDFSLRRGQSLKLKVQTLCDRAGNVKEGDFENRSVPIEKYSDEGTSISYAEFKSPLF